VAATKGSEWAGTEQLVYHQRIWKILGREVKHRHRYLRNTEKLTKATRGVEHEAVE